MGLRILEVGWEEASSQPLSLRALETEMATTWTYRKIGHCKQSMICSLSNDNNCFFRLIVNLKKALYWRGAKEKALMFAWEAEGVFDLGLRAPASRNVWSAGFLSTQFCRQDHKNDG